MMRESERMGVEREKESHLLVLNKTAWIFVGPIEITRRRRVDQLSLYTYLF